MYMIHHYCLNRDNKKFYNEVVNTKVTDYLPNGKRRCDLSMVIPLVSGIAKMKNDKNFISDLDNWLSLIEYDEEQVRNEINEKIKTYIVSN